MKKLATLLIIAVALTVISCQPPQGSVVTTEQLDAVKAELSALKTDVAAMKVTVDSLTIKCDACAAKCLGKTGGGAKPPGTVKPPTGK